MVALESAGVQQRRVFRHFSQVHLHQPGMRPLVIRRVESHSLAKRIVPSQLSPSGVGGSNTDTCSYSPTAAPSLDDFDSSDVSSTNTLPRAEGFKKRHTTAPISTLALVFQHPHLVSFGILSQTPKLLLMLHNSEVGPLKSFCDACPAQCLGTVLPELLSGLRVDAIESVLAPLVNLPHLHGALVAMMTQVDATIIIEILNGSSFERLEILLCAQPIKLTQLVTAVDEDRVHAMLLPLQSVPAAVRDMVDALENPERAGAVVNYVDPLVLVWLLQCATGSAIANLMNAFLPHDFEASGCIVYFLQKLEGERRLSQEFVAIFVQLVPPAVVAELVQRVSAEKLLEALRRVGPEGIARILANTNVDFVIRLWNGPLEGAVTFMAGTLSEIERNRIAAKALKKATDGMDYGLVRMESHVRRGKLQRRGRQHTQYRVGDFSRGFLSKHLKFCNPRREPSDLELIV